MKFTAKIEQTINCPKRLRYDHEKGVFEETEYDSLFYVRNVPEPYGWIKESGTPPKAHLDVIVMTELPCEPGDEIPVRVIGVFVRADGDNKLIAVPDDRPENDISELSDKEKDDLHRLYPVVREGEGWRGKERAMRTVSDFLCRGKAEAEKA